MASELLVTPSRALDADGNPYSGAKWYFYQTGTLTPENVYSDAALSTSLGATVTADSGGKFPNVYFDVTKAYRGVLKNADGSVTLHDIDPINTDTFAQLALSGGSALVGFLQGGTGAVGRTVQAKLRDTISVKDFGAAGDGVTDDTAAINAAINYAKTLAKPKLVIDRGVYLITSGLVFDLPNYSTIEFIGEIVTSGTLIPAVMIGSSSTNTFGLAVTGLKVRRTSNDTTGGSIGAQMRNIVASTVWIVKVTGFQTGIDCYADQANGGVSYCQFHLGFVQDNRYNLILRETGSGYVNENIFYGGNFNHSSGYPAVSTVNLWIQYDNYRHNNNRFYSPSFEDNSTLAVAAIINGDNNLIIHPRMERAISSSTYEIQFTATSSENQIVGAGFSILPTNIADSGAGNCYETRQSVLIRKQAPVGAGNGVIRARGTVSDSARVLVSESTAGNATFYTQGSGKVFSAANGYFENGIRYSTSSGSLEDRGVFIGSGSPNTVVTAEPGSLYVNTSGGAGATLYVKESGSGNTGWAAK